MTWERVQIVEVITSLAGGAGLQAYHLARYMDPSRFAVRLVFGPGYPLDATVVNERLPHDTVRWTRRVNPVRCAFGLRDFVRILRRERPDVVHAHCSLAGVLGRLAARRCRVPHVLFTFHAFASHNWQPRWRKRIYLAIERAMDRVTERYCVYSRRFRKEVVLRRIAPAAKVSVIPLGIEVGPRPTSADQHRARASLGLGPGTLGILMAARLERQKGLPYLVEAFAGVAPRVPAARLLIVGDGPLRPSLEREVARRGLGGVTRFLGWRSDIPALLPGADIFCLASLWESGGYAYLEAMAAGVPVVGTRVDGVPEYVEDGQTGLLVPPADVPALAEALQALLEDAECRRRFGAAGRHRVEEQFTLAMMIRRYEDLYAEVAAPSGVQA